MPKKKPIRQETHLSLFNTTAPQRTKRPLHESLGKTIRDKLEERAFASQLNEAKESDKSKKDAMLDAIIMIAMDPENPKCVYAANMLLERGWGKIPNTITVEGAFDVIRQQLPEEALAQLAGMVQEFRDRKNSAYTFNEETSEVEFKIIE